MKVHEFKSLLVFCEGYLKEKYRSHSSSDLIAEVNRKLDAMGATDE